MTGHQTDGPAAPRRRPAAFRLNSDDAEAPQIEPEREDTTSDGSGRQERAAGGRSGLVRGRLSSGKLSWGNLSWGGLFFAALGGLVSLGIGLSIDRLIGDLFARSDWLGWTATGLAAATVLAAVAIVMREGLAIARLGRIDRLREKAQAAAEADDRREAEIVVAQTMKLFSTRPETAAGRAALARHLEDVIDGRDLIRLGERELLRPLDSEARRMIMETARRVSVVTALSPRAFIDILFVLISAAGLIRRLARLYGGRPGLIGFVALARHVIGHLAVTGGIAAGDSLLHEVIGKGLATRLSSRLGEGVVNGLMTARVGLAAMDVCRPLPFLDAQRPRVADIVGEIASGLPTARDEKADEATR